MEEGTDATEAELGGATTSDLRDGKRLVRAGGKPVVRDAPADAGPPEPGKTETGGPASGGPAIGGPASGGPAIGGPDTGMPALAGPALGGPASGGPAIGGPDTGMPALAGPAIDPVYESRFAHGRVIGREVEAGSSPPGVVGLGTE